MKEKRNSNTLYTIIISVYVCIPALNLIFIAAIPSLSGKLMSVLYLICGFFLISIYVKELFQTKKLFISQFVQIFYILLITMGYTFTLLTVSYSELKITKFVMMTLIAILCPNMKKINIKLFVWYVMTFPSIGILFLNKIFVVQTGIGLSKTITMGTSYAFLPPIIATIIYFKCFYAQTSRWKRLIVWLFVLVNMIYLIQLVQYGSRGPTLAILMCVLFYAIYNQKKGNYGIQHISVKIFWLCVMLIVIYINFVPILQIFQSFLERMSIKLNTVDKFFRLMETRGEMSNGRNKIWIDVAQEIQYSPIWGHGFSTTLHNLQYVYPHNFVLQLFYDGGLLLALPILIPFFMGIKKWITTCSQKDYIFGGMMFFISVPGAMLSHDVWENGNLWITISYFILYFFV